MSFTPSRAANGIALGPWIITGLVLGLILAVVAWMAALPWGVPAAVLRVDFPTTRYVREFDIEWEDPLDLTIDDQRRIWVENVQVPDLTDALRAHRARSYREWTENGRTCSSIGSLRLRADRHATWGDIVQVCVAAIDADFGGIDLRCRAVPDNGIAWLHLAFFDPVLSGASGLEVGRLALHSADAAHAAHARAELQRRQRAAGDGEFSEPIVDVRLPPELSVQESISLLECYLNREGRVVRVAGMSP